MTNLTKKEKRLLLNFVLAESRRITFPTGSGFSGITEDLLVEIKVKLSYVNLNNFNRDVKKYEQALKRLIKKLSK